MGKPRNSNNGVRIGFWHMWRDIFVTSMNKGQFPIALAGLIILVVLLKMPDEAVSTIVLDVYSELKAGYLWGWVISSILPVAWFLHAKHQRRLMHDEIARLSQERNDVQERLLGKRLSSSAL